MPRLSRVQQEALQQVRQLASRTLLPEQLGTMLLEALRKAIPSDMQMLLGVDLASRLFNRLLDGNLLAVSSQVRSQQAQRAQVIALQSARLYSWHLFPHHR